MNLTKESFRLIFSLIKKQPWINERYEELSNLIYNECSNQDQKDLILSLLDRFVYVSNEKFNQSLHEMAEDIVSDPDIEDSTTQIVAMAADSSSDSSQYILYGLKPIFENHGWDKYLHVNKFSRSLHNYNKYKKHKNIVLVDEFVGSGRTVLGRTKEISRIFSESNVENFTIRVKSIVSTEYGYNKLIENGIKFTSQIILKKGISDFYSDHDELMEKIYSMLSIESILLDKHNTTSLPNLGFGGAEALYCRQGGNTPNNVFPVFWWPFYKDGNRRRTVLTRSMADL